jgi:DNA-binding transcriptional regulator GbsR (MarR family)
LQPVAISFEEAVAAIPTKEWCKNCDDKERVEWYLKIDDLLQQFIKALSADPLRQVDKTVKKLTIELNELQDDEHFIETMEREDLFTFISTLLEIKKKDSAIEVLEEYRDW